ncbi:hypothetical protein HUE87_08385 [Candidatus Sulfurimonas marisnigri]|uniref:Uncharacterized protein n=1 Tax=Candidatus Sulfurimonas marisnigri TaxID=2740405 RepID=A0A7S7LYR7_9BACT|nr:hypothetical protein [Candidatus Sulfurimonas marisnigri]QOY53911.1 hypothetical protein HUE87_08385 [Candidatus Sulfurimonas marisnigri]
MVKIGRFFAYFLFFTLAIMYFTPKVSVYYYLEQKLNSYSVIVSKEDVKDNGFGLSIKDAVVSVKTVDSATISNIEINLFTVYNTIDFKGITLSPVATSFLPLHVKSVNIKYSIFDPLNIKAVSVGEFGEVDSYFNIIDRVFHLNLKPSKIMLKDYKNTLKNLKKSENGEYIYEKHI